MSARTGIEPDKAALRAAMARRRKAAASAADAGVAGGRLADRFEAALALPAGAPVSGYWPIGSEIDVRPLLERLARAGHPLGLPVVEGRGRPLLFRAWRPGEPLEPAGFGLAQPPADRPVVTPRVLLVPLLAFDRAGWRLGYGGGFYDRTLERLRAVEPATLAVGLAWAAQEVERVPLEPTDQRLDWIVTEAEAIRIQED
jgi:5-formyltetrahydrofolate cyclo-ligase